MSTLLESIEECLLPSPEIVYWDDGKLRIEEYTTTKKVVYYVKNIFALLGLVILAPLALTYEWLLPKTAVAPKQVTPLQGQAQQPPSWPPFQRGFASSLFQTSGLGTKWSASPPLQGKCDWDKWLDNPKHISHAEGFEYSNFFIDVLSNPVPYIEMLTSHHVTAHRFSLEWSVIEPKRGEIDIKAVELYRNFIEKLLQAGITPSITLSHFTVPEWFYESGNFQTISNIDCYVQFALKAMDLFPEVKDWWSFNEIGIKAFQQLREVYPTDLPEGSSLSQRIHAAGIATRNMLIAHCKLHQEVAILHPDKQLGVTHQWLKFDTATGNFLEKIVAHYLTKSAFTPVYQFLKEGRYSFKIPFMANIEFRIPQEEFEKNHHFLMRLGVQAYPLAMIKMGLNHGETYPGPPSGIKNYSLFTFGATCEKGGTIMRFGPRWNAKRMDDILDEAFAITDQVFITEYGSDAIVQKWGEPTFQQDDPAQKEYLQQLTDRIRQYSLTHFKPIQGMFCWTDLRGQIEWEDGHNSKLATVEPIVDKITRRMTGWRSTPASSYIAEIFKGEKGKDLRKASSW